MRELETSMTQKGQVTIPIQIRKRLGLRPKDKVRFHIEGQQVTLQPAPSRLLEAYGAIKPHRRPEDWRSMRDQAEQAVAEDANHS